MSNQTPLNILLENTRSKFIQAFNQVIDETKLPACLYEGMLLEILSEIRSRKNFELMSDINTLKSQTNGKEES